MDINIKIEAEALGKSLDDLADSVVEEIQSAVDTLAQSAYAMAISKVQDLQIDPKARSSYIKGLNLTDLGNNSYLLELDGDWPNKLEDGYPSYDMKIGMLKSKKIVEVGSRAGQPWVQVGKDGDKYAHVPFHYKPFSKDPGVNQMSSLIKKATAKNSKGLDQKLTQIFKDGFGRPLSGKVAHSDIEGIGKLNKYQHVYDKAVQSVYISYKTVSEKSSGWIHPGHPGYHIFEEVEEYVVGQVRSILNTLVK